VTEFSSIDVQLPRPSINDELKPLFGRHFIVKGCGYTVEKDWILNIQLEILVEMTGSTKYKILILLGLVTIITMIIAASLSQLELQPGMPLPKLQDNNVVAPSIEAEPFAAAISINKFIIIFFALILAGSILYMMYKLIRGADWKEIAAFFRMMVVISLLVSGVAFLIMLLPKSESSMVMEMPIPTPEPVVTSPLGPVPPLLLWVVGIGLLVISILVGVWMLTSSRRTRPIDLVGLEAEKAWQALKTGLDLKDVIIRCYRQMSIALEKEQGIERKDFMTTGEFENLLEDVGIPHDPIHQLTRLFDAVRYGNWQPNPIDEQNAIQCLEAIMSYSRESKGTT
jgi:hypothetical protein